MDKDSEDEWSEEATSNNILGNSPNAAATSRTSFGLVGTEGRPTTIPGPLPSLPRTNSGSIFQTGEAHRFASSKIGQPDSRSRDASTDGAFAMRMFSGSTPSRIAPSVATPAPGPGLRSPQFGQPMFSTNTETLSETERDVARRLKSQHDAELLRYKGREEELNQKVKDLEDRVIRISREKNDTQVAGEKAKSRVVAEFELQKRTIRSLQERVAQEKQAGGDNSRAVTELEAMIKIKNEQLGKEKKEVATLNGFVDRLCAENDELRESAKKGRDRAEAAEKHSEADRAQLEALQRKADEAQRHAAASEIRSAELQKLLDLKQATLDHREDENARLRKTSGEIRQRLEDQQKLHRKDHDELALRQKLVNGHSISFKKVQDQLKDALDRVDDLKSQLARSREDVATMQNDLDELNSQFVRSQKDAAAFKNARDDAIVRLDLWKSKAETAEEDRAEKNSWERKAKQAMERLRQANNKLYHIALMKDRPATASTEPSSSQLAPNVSRKVMSHRTRQLPDAASASASQVSQVSTQSNQDTGPPDTQSNLAPAPVSETVPPVPDPDEYIKIEDVENGSPKIETDALPEAGLPPKGRMESSKRESLSKRKRDSISPSDMDFLVPAASPGHRSQNSFDSWGPPPEPISTRDSFWDWRDLGRAPEAIDKTAQDDATRDRGQKETKDTTAQVTVDNAPSSSPGIHKTMNSSKLKKRAKFGGVAKKSAPSSKGGLLEEQDTIRVSTHHGAGARRKSVGSVSKKEAMKNFNLDLGVPENARPTTVKGKLAFVPDDDDEDEGSGGDARGRKPRRKAATALMVGRDVGNNLQ